VEVLEVWAELLVVDLEIDEGLGDLFTRGLGEGAGRELKARGTLVYYYFSVSVWSPPSTLFSR